MMKLSKNILIVIGSYLGMLVLVFCTAQFLIPLTSGGEGDLTVNAGVTEDVDAMWQETEDVPMGGFTTDGADTDAAVVGTDRVPTVGDAMEDPDGEGNAEVYCLRTFREAGSLTPAVIGVYDGEGNLLRTLETPVLALPAGDRALLDVGIEVSGEEALMDLIEDFGG